MNPSNMINFRKLSAYLSGNDQSVRKKRVYDKHKAAVDDLIKTIEQWMQRHRPLN